MALIVAAPETRVFRQHSPDHPEWAFDLQTAVNRARPGDVIQLLPGRYTGSTFLTMSGTADKPITLRGSSVGRSILDGGRTRDHGRHSGLEPLDGDFAVLKLVGAKHLVLEGLFFEHPWPTAVYMRASRNITIRHCHAAGGRFFVYARELPFAKTHDIVLDSVSWVQDPDHDMWDGRVTWTEVKAQRGAFDASYFNGALFGSFDISGGVTICRCNIAHAFNAIRMDCRDTRVRSGADGLTVSRNHNVAIYDNTFAFIRDNAIEPETAAADWRVFNNRFYNVHAAFSLDGVVSRDMFYLSNTILNDRKPGLLGQENQGGKIFKFLGSKNDAEDPRRRENLVSAFNSVQSRTCYAKKGVTQHWLDAWNAVGLYPADYPDITTPPREVFNKMGWQDGITILGMVCNDPEFPNKYVKEGAQIDTATAVGNVFEDTDYDASASDWLGGWTGALTKSSETQSVITPELTLTRANGPDIVFPPGLTPGAQDLDALGLTDILKHSPEGAGV